MASSSRNGKLKIVALALVASALCAGAALAATVLKVSVAEATRLSKWVVKARVTALTPVDLRAEGDSIYTDVTLQIDAVYRGSDVPERYVMRLMGGIGEDGMALTVPGMPQFALGDEAVLFLEKNKHGHVPCGMEQGVWRVAKGPLGYPIVYRSLGGLALMEKAADGKLAPAAPGGPLGAKLLTTLVAEINAANR